MILTNLLRWKYTGCQYRGWKRTFSKWGLMINLFSINTRHSFKFLSKNSPAEGCTIKSIWVGPIWFHFRNEWDEKEGLQKVGNLYYDLQEQKQN